MSAMASTYWHVDPLHSTIQFSVQHLLISTVNGTFDSFHGTMEWLGGHDLSDLKVYFEVDTDSIDTHVADRDEHLKSVDFFDAVRFPTLKFESTSLEKQADHYILRGDLTIKDRTESIEFEVRFGGIAYDTVGKKRAGFEVKGSVNRKKFGLVWDEITEAGSVVVGADIAIRLSLQFIQQA